MAARKKDEGHQKTCHAPLLRELPAFLRYEIVSFNEGQSACNLQPGAAKANMEDPR